MSEQQAAQTEGEAGSVTATPMVHPSADALIEKALASVQAARVEAPEIAPDHETLPRADEPTAIPPRLEPSKAEGRAEMPKFDASKFPTPQVGPIRVELSKADPRIGPKAEQKAESKAEPKAPRAAAARVMIMAPAGPAEHGKADAPRPGPDPASAEPRQRRFGAMAAVAVLALAAGAVGGALAAGFTQRTAAAAATSDDASSLNASIARIDAEILSLKAGLERTGKQETSQFNKTNDRLDKIEKAQAEPATRLAKLAEAVDKLRGASAAAPAAGFTSVAAKESSRETIREATASAPVSRDITGSAPAASGAAATPQQVVATAAPAKGDKTDFSRLPKVEGWVLRDVSHGGALIEGRQGFYEVYAGDPVPGLGRVDAIRKQDGRWVVVTTKGLVVAR